LFDVSPCTLRHALSKYVSLLAVATAGCGGGDAEVVIGYTSNAGVPNAGTVAEVALERTRRPGERRIRVLMGDSVAPAGGGAGSLALEVERATRLAARSDVVGVVGPGGSRQALHVAPIYREAGLVDVVPTATSRLLGDAGTGAFLLAANDSVQGAFLAAFAKTALGARSAVIFYLPDEYGRGLAAGTTAALWTLNIRLVDRMPVRPTGDCTSPRGQAYFADLISVVTLRGTPDVAVLAVRTAEAACLAPAARARWPRVKLLTGDGVSLDAEFAARVGEAADSLYGVTFWHSTPDDSASRSFVVDFRRITGREPGNEDAMFYDATMLLGDAIRIAGADRRAIQRHFTELGRARPSYLGVTGPISFDTARRPPLLMIQLVGGRSVVVAR
jgi:ABC-type branched-subunit amino acid transport system substrate-binding protein